MQAIDVIGGSGFIGSRLVNRLQKEKSGNLKIIDKRASALHSHIGVLADVRDVIRLRETLTENAVIINLAAEHRDDVRPVSLYDEVNVLGARNICRVATEKGVKTIIFTSTVAVYGFAEIGTDETGPIAPFNAYGRTKYEAELILRAWQAEMPKDRTLTIIRPTVVFGERNRGNVYNLIRQIASRRFLMVGAGRNRKSLAYVENVAAFIQYSMDFKPGIHVYNYVDKPDFTMNDLVAEVQGVLGRSQSIKYRIPYFIGYSIGKLVDIVAGLFGKTFPISALRVKKFCSNSVYNSATLKTAFKPPFSMKQALRQTVRHEFLENHDDEPVFISE